MSRSRRHVEDFAGRGVRFRGRSGGDGCGAVNGRTLSAEELSRDVEGLAADDNNLLAVQELLGDGAGQATEQVSLAVNDDLYTAFWSAIAP